MPSGGYTSSMGLLLKYGGVNLVLDIGVDAAIEDVSMRF